MKIPPEIGDILVPVDGGAPCFVTDVRGDDVWGFQIEINGEWCEYGVGWIPEVKDGGT
jgi:hypothetical protein